MRTSRCLIALALAVAGLLGSAGSASAGVYYVYSCKAPNGAAASTDGWSPSKTLASGTTSNGCANGGSLNLTVPGSQSQPATGVVGWRYDAVPDTRIDRFLIWRSAVVRHSASEQNSSPIAYISFPTQNLDDALEYCGVGCDAHGVMTDQIMRDNLKDSGDFAGTDSIFFTGACVGYTACGPRMGNMVEYRVQGMEARFRDGFDPTSTRIGGTLTQPGTHKGIDSVSFDAQDRGSGLYRTRIELQADGTSGFTPQVTQILDDNDGRCSELDNHPDTDHEFTFRQPCKLSASEDAQFDTASVPDGDYEVRVRVEDAAGNLATVLAPTPITIDNVPPPAATSPPVVTGSPQRASTLTALPGTWSGKDNQYEFQWLRCTSAGIDSCGDISGATAATYTVVTDDLGRFLRVRVKATNREGEGIAVSDSRGPITLADGTVPQCADGVDNDGDGKIDLDDSACGSRAGTNEAAETTPSGGFSHPVPLPTPQPTAEPAKPGPPKPVAGEPNGANASGRARLSVSGPRRRVLRYGRGGTVSLALRDEGGKAISRAAVVVLQRMKVPGARWVAAHPPVTTDADGRVRYAIRPGYSRVLRFGYRDHEGDAAFAAQRDLAINVRSKTTLRTNRSFLRNGHAVRFKGRVKSRPVPRAGVVIDLQAHVGRHWQTFNTLRTNSAGRWRAHYRFRSTRGLQTYKFRARVRGDSGFPYAPSTSRSVKVRVRG